MAINFEQFLWAITQQESGGNYKALGVWLNMSYGRDRAYGRYQVMGANIPSWTAKYYGKRLTPAQFLKSRAAQDAVVRGRLGALVKKYGFRGAASAWYSGDASLHMSTRPQKGGPSIKKYVDSVMSRAATFKGGNAFGGGGGSVAPAVPKLDRDELAAQYGLTAALINSSGELKKLFGKAVSGQWSAAKFQASLKSTNWWKKQSNTLRQYVTLRFTDPATWKQQRTEALVAMNALAVQVGLGDQIDRKTGKASKLLVAAAYNSQALGWSEARLKDWLGSRADVHNGFMYGEAGDAWDKIHEVAYLNGIRYSADWYKKQAVAVVSGKAALSTIEDTIRRTAAGRYFAFGDQIKAGMNVMDLAAPYIKSTAGILELPESDIDLFNPHVAKAMTAKTTGADGAQMPLWQFENELREDPLWKKTNNARESMMTVAREVARNFGMAY